MCWMTQTLIDGLGRPCTPKPCSPICLKKRGVKCVSTTWRAMGLAAIALSPRHGTPLISRHVGSKRLSMTSPAKSAGPYCYLRKQGFTTGLRVMSRNEGSQIVW